ncbi:dihydrofolate reductase family protein [Chitinophaga varians]|uniref:dihydrofolate reductase family protein n=1 Tax=Chitinophaga varians TaxID=2202339 RepID=UPI00165FAA6D|nr:dihydrofolate reductase family protein [Chitinophaga varians]MBC9915085.1 dihydrofolate reductase family protein [Chitinophaga varians]
MRKLILQMQVSVDGFVADAHGNTGWLVSEWDQPLKDYVLALTARVDLILIGRKLAHQFIPAWTARAGDPDIADEYTHRMNDLDKVVFSRTQTEHGWKNTVLVNENLTEEVARLKKSPGGDIITYGGSSFAASLIQEHLIDEFHLFVNPMAIGKGLPIFHQLHQQLPVKLVSATSFSCGIVVLFYQPQYRR